MSAAPVFFREQLETNVPYWRIERTDGVTLGFVAHDRDLWFDGLRYRAAPGMIPSAIRRQRSLSPDEVDVEGALAHDALSERDLALGRYDAARVVVGIVDWETLRAAELYVGTIGSVAREAGRFTASLGSVKDALAIDPVPRTSPTCRAEFCGPDCGLSASRFTTRASLASIDIGQGALTFSGLGDAAPYRHGWLRWLDGPLAGIGQAIHAVEADTLYMAAPLEPMAVGTRALLREGCDHLFATCSTRFGNAAHFRGEPFLPGIDVLTRGGGS